jgi:intein/homing endonuclease
MDKGLEEFFQRIHPIDGKYCVYGDTDSVVGDSVITTNYGGIKIEDLFNDSDGEVEIRGKDNLIKHLPHGLKAASVNDNFCIEYNDVSYVMAHKVKKEMFKIKSGGKEVVITGDHSIMICRGERLISGTVHDLRKGDEIVMING